VSVVVDPAEFNSGTAVAVGPGDHGKEGKLIPVALKEGDQVLLPEHGGLQVKLDPDKQVYVTHFTLVLRL
jgi:chaperonin GroES